MSSKQESLHDTNEDDTLSFNNDEALALYEDAKLTKSVSNNPASSEK